MRQCGLNPTINQWNTPTIVGGDLYICTVCTICIKIMLIVKLTKYFNHFQKKVTTHYITLKSKGNFTVNNLIAVANLMLHVHK